MIHDALGRFDGRNLHLAHADGSPGGGAASLSAALAGLFVGGKVKGDEEKEVGAQDAHACKGSKLLAGAPAVAGELGEVCRGEVGVGSEVDET